MEVPVERLGDIGDLCPGCGAEANFVSLFPVSTEYKVDFVECRHCGIGTSSKLPNEELVMELYEPESYSSSLTSDNSLSRRCAARIMPHIQVTESSGTFRILDYGGGNGNLSRQLISMLSQRYPKLSVTATVIDLYERKPDGAISFVTVSEFEQSDSKYELVIASAILEHLVDVRSVMDQLVACGKPKSVFYARTPYEVPLSKLLGRSLIRWPRHLHDMGPEYWQYLQVSYNGKFKILESRTSLVETSFSTRPVRTLIAHLLKTPSRLEHWLRGNVDRVYWKLVGGWEVIAILNEND